MRLFRQLLLAIAGLAIAISANAAERLQPFVLASTGTGDVATKVAEVKGKLKGAGFEVVGDYTPYADTTIVIVTSSGLKKAAAQSEFGAYGAVQRVSVTKHNGELQVAYTNPIYMSNAYRMEDELTSTGTALKKALGSKKVYGSKKGLKAKKLRKYHYMFGMPYFDDPSMLAEHKNYKAAVAAVEKGLAAGKSAITKVYRVDIPGKDETVFGVAMKGNKIGKPYQDDEYIMSEIDFKGVRSSAHLPYELVVSGNKVYALSAKFRIAMNFPDLKMMGDNSFMNIMESPGAVEDALEAVAAGN
ncbi:hypothetical protein [Candidatus Reidiella endopervernicosa]|nr:hypothetical protein [Candidatus Reidiella endopervernicosa]